MKVNITLQLFSAWYQGSYFNWLKVQKLNSLFILQIELLIWKKIYIFDFRDSFGKIFYNINNLNFSYKKSWADKKNWILNIKLKSRIKFK